MRCLDLVIIGFIPSILDQLNVRTCTANLEFEEQLGASSNYLKHSRVFRPHIVNKKLYFEYSHEISGKGWNNRSSIN